MIFLMDYRDTLALQTAQSPAYQRSIDRLTGYTSRISPANSRKRIRYELDRTRTVRKQ